MVFPVDRNGLVSAPARFITSRNSTALGDLSRARQFQLFTLDISPRIPLLPPYCYRAVSSWALNYLRHTLVFVFPTLPLLYSLTSFFRQKIFLLSYQQMCHEALTQRTWLNPGPLRHASRLVVVTAIGTHDGTLNIAALSQ